MYFCSLCQSGGTGRRARFKIVFLRECGFESHLAHWLLKGVNMNKAMISRTCFIASLVSVAFSIATWTMVGDSDPAHAERFGIFVGLWAPTLLGLANYFRE